MREDFNQQKQHMQEVAADMKVFMNTMEERNSLIENSLKERNSVIENSLKVKETTQISADHFQHLFK